MPYASDACACSRGLARPQAGLRGLLHRSSTRSEQAWHGASSAGGGWQSIRRGPCTNCYLRAQRRLRLVRLGLVPVHVARRVVQRQHERIRPVEGGPVLDCRG
jgi:hypothetical protein